MNTVTAAHEMCDVAHEHRGDLFRAEECLADTAARIRAHLSEVLPDMEITARHLRRSGFGHLRVSIVRYNAADLSERAAGFAARRLVDAELKRFTRYDWDPHGGIRNQSLSTDTSIDPALHAAALHGGPELQPLVSFAEFTRTARPGDILEHVAGKEPPEGARVMITAISARRLTTRLVDPATDARESRVPIRGGACFVSDGELVCFKHSGFAHQGGYSLLRWTRQA